MKASLGDEVDNMNTEIIIGGILILLVAWIFFMNPGGSGTGSNVTDKQIFGANDTVANIALALGSNGYYSPQEIRVKVGTKVRLSGDTNTLRGCMSTVIIDGYDVRKRMVAGDNTVEFVADKPGVYGISCPMGMGGGKLIVEDSSGNIPSTAPQAVAPAQQHTCGGGGCGGGCGG
jgi:plastocyanin domain-containing protein